ncbi:MAG: DUF4224 domain-containing protein [Pseudomonadota bacterium]
MIEPNKPQSLTLTNDEIAELSGYTNAEDQIKWLKANRFKFVLDRWGKPRVSRAYYEVRFGGGIELFFEHAKEPNWAAVQDAPKHGRNKGD